MTAMPGFTIEEQSPSFVVAGLDFDFNYETMKKACQAIRRGAHFIATNADATLPVEGGEVWPGAGSIVASLGDVLGGCAHCDRQAEHIYGDDRAREAGAACVTGAVCG